MEPDRVGPQSWFSSGVSSSPFWPLGVPEWVSSLGRRVKTPAPVGRVLRTDAPGIVRVAVDPTTTWDQNSPKIYQQADGRQRLLIPLYAHLQEHQLLGTGICIDSPIDDVPSLEPGHVYEPAAPLQYDNAEVARDLVPLHRTLMC